MKMVRTEVNKTAGEGAGFRVLTEKELLEIRDIACWAEKVTLYEHLQRPPT